jgi:hypothetical protein
MDMSKMRRIVARVVFVVGFKGTVSRNDDRDEPMEQ